MKSKTGKLTDNQMVFRDKVIHEKYNYVVCRDFDEFIMRVNEYLSLTFEQKNNKIYGTI